MKIGILITSVSNFGESGFYNSQEIGLAKALSEHYTQVDVYKLTTIDKVADIYHLKKYPNVVVHILPAKNFGINGIIDVGSLNRELNVLIHFSDTQFSVPRVYKWCQKNEVRYVPYVGVIESHSSNILKQIAVNLLFKRNLAVYRKCRCFVKTPTVKNQLHSIGVKDIITAPVGLDTSLLKSDYLFYSASELKKKYGYNDSDRVLLFIGRLVNEKNPVKIIELLSELKKVDSYYKLLMVGSGELEREVINRINSIGLDTDVQRINRIPNDQIWELYRFADCFVNLNQNEIFGMAILEAMYYECKVVAWKAPGPCYIIEDEVSGYLVSDESIAIDRILNGPFLGEKSKLRITEHFTWDATAQIMKNAIDAGGQHG